MKGDYFFGTRDVTMSGRVMQALFEYGVPGWLDAINITLSVTDIEDSQSKISRWITRKGACPANQGQAVILPA